MDLLIVQIVLILFISTLIRSTFGFGDSVLAMPLLAVIVDLQLATPLVALIALSISTTILLLHWQQVYFKNLLRLILPTLAGIPIGIIMLRELNESLIKLLLAVVIVLFSIFNLGNFRELKIPGKKSASVAGFLGGIFGGAYNISGPPVVIYGALNRWPQENFRATLQGYFLITGIMLVSGHIISGNINEGILKIYLTALPFVFIAIFLGFILNRKIRKENFTKYLYVLLLIIGISLIVSLF